MASNELKVLNSVLKNGDIGTLFKQDIDELFQTYGDTWGFIKEYYAKHRAVPSIDLVRENYDIADVDVDGATAYYVENLVEDFKKAKLNLYATNIALLFKEGASGEDVLTQVQAKLSELNKFSANARDVDIMNVDEAKEHYDELRKRVEENGGVSGIPTGISTIDAAYPTGLSPGNLVMFLGYPARGKSLLTGYVGANAYVQGYHPMLVSMEMTEEEVRDRVYTIMGSGLFRGSELALGDYDPENFQQFKDSIAGKGKFTVVADNGGEEITP